MKGRVPDRGKLAAVLDYVGGWGNLPEVVHHDAYFSHPCRDFRKTDEALRLRHSTGEEEKWYLTYKGPRLDGLSKTRDESEVQVHPAVREILLRLGFEEVARVVKRRRGFVKGDQAVFVDEVQGLGTYVEIESRSHDQDALPVLLGVLEQMGLQSETRSYLELLQAGT